MIPQHSNAPGITVIMPTYNQAFFIRKAILSIQRQYHKNWELIVVDDGSDDNTQAVLSQFLDSRIRYFRNDINRGLGFSINQGIDHATYDYIAYLPSDDFFYPEHLDTLINVISKQEKCILAFSGIHHSVYSVTNSVQQHSLGKIDGYPMQLVQVMHRKTDVRWIEREEFVTDDLFQLFWKKLVTIGLFICTRKVTCEWVSHLKQHHKIISEQFGGGIYTYRHHYKVNGFINFRSTGGMTINEKRHYASVKDNVSQRNGLKIVLVGELTYNPDRICALEEYGHKLYGLWIENPKFSNSVGPFPFSNLVNIPNENWIEELQTIKPDIIYAQQGYDSVKFAHLVMKNNPSIPFVWHFKEGPQICRNDGSWNELLELYSLSDGQIYINQLAKEWYSQFILPNSKCSFILDGDLPKRDWFTNEKSEKLLSVREEMHTVMIGRPVGIRPEDIAALARHKIHVHLYGNYQETWRSWIKQSKQLAKDFLHIHKNCAPGEWVQELSRYDAGWIHYFKSENNGNSMRADWHDLNLPARMSTLAAAGLPMIQYNNAGHLVASQDLSKELDIGIYVRNFSELAEKLNDSLLMSRLKSNVWNHRMKFTFDYYVPDLTAFFNKVIKEKSNDTK